jgi:uncharacterized protein YlxW (UPF0749 family)
MRKHGGAARSAHVLADRWQMGDLRESDDAPASSPLSTRVAASMRNRSLAWRLSVPAACACAGLLATTSMINADGTDLRGGRHSDLIGLVSEQRSDVQELRRTVQSLQNQVDALSQQVPGGQSSQLRRQLAAVAGPAGLDRLTGPGITIALDDAPRSQAGGGDIDPNLLIVHQQDIQAVVNALWAGGAEGITLQGQRIISTTGIKCVGNTVVLQGVPYSPPYRIAAVGDSGAMYDAVMAARGVQTYLQYTQPPYNLGWSLRQLPTLSIKPYTGSLDLDYAQAATLP